MKNRTINRILQGVIVILIIAICILSVQIIRRPHYINITEAETTVIEEAVASTTSVDTEIDTEDALSTAELPSSTLRGKTSTKVNIRDAASDQAKVLATVEEGYEFDIVEIQDNGWTKLK